MGEHRTNLCNLKSKFTITLNIIIVLYLEKKMCLKVQATFCVDERPPVPNKVSASLIESQLSVLA